MDASPSRPKLSGRPASDAFAIWEERKALRALLTAEADRAKRGDQPIIQEH